MKNYLLICLLVSLTISVSGQSKEVSVSLSGYRVETKKFVIYDGQRDLWNFEEASLLCNIGLGCYIPVFNPDPNIGIGVNASINSGLRFASSGSHEIFADLGLPVTATFRLGAGSTPDSDWPVGLGIGAGYRLNAIVVPSGDPFYIQEDPVAMVLFRPYLFAEIVLDHVITSLKIQCAYQPVYTRSAQGEQTGEETTSKMHYFSISVIKYFTFN